MRICRTLVVAILFLAPVAAAQDTMPVVVQPNWILIGKEFVPRCVAQPKVLIVPARQTVEAAADSTFDCIEVAGTLRVSRSHDTVLRFTHLFVLPGGTLDVGTKADPIPAERSVDLVVRDVPINTVTDPFQWGNGLVNFGHQSRVAATKVAWAPLSSEAAAGATTLELAADPTGWRAGDELLITETRQPTHDRSMPIRRETPVFVSAVSGRTVTLSKPLDFAHLAIKAPDGRVVAQARVANLTRSIVLRSENPNGTAGHSADVGHMAMWDVRYNRFDGIGRTRNVTLNDAAPDASAATGFKPGTNQRGRYADHHHHAMGFGSSSIGNVYVGHPDAPVVAADGIARTYGPKWGLVVHNVHDGLFADNVAIQFAGSGFVSEDGNEVRNVFRHNFAAYNVGNHNGRLNLEFVNTQNENNPGGAGNGFWFRAAYNDMDGNEAWNNPIGINLFSVVDLPLLFPSKPGGFDDTRMTEVRTVPLTVRDNVANANSIVGFEYWFYPDLPNVNAIAAYNGIDQFLQGSSVPARPNFVNPTFVGFEGQTSCIGSTTAYVATLKVTGGRLEGCATGITGGGARTVTITGTTFQNVVNFDASSMPDLGMALTDVTFLPMPGRPAQYIIFGKGPASCWDGLSPHGHLEGISWESQRGSIWFVNNYNGDGKHYQLFNTCQLGSRPAPYSVGDRSEAQFQTPEVGLTMLQSWQKYGVAIFGEAVDDAKAIALPGLVNGFAREGTASTLGPPRFVITSPTLRAPAFVFDNGSPKKRMRLYGLMTGDPAQAQGPGLMSIDGGTPFAAAQSPMVKYSSDDCRIDIDAPADGIHTARTWRTDANNVAIPSSLMTFQFTVGTNVATPR